MLRFFLNITRTVSYFFIISIQKLRNLFQQKYQAYINKYESRGCFYSWIVSLRSIYPTFSLNKSPLIVWSQLDQPLNSMWQWKMAHDFNKMLKAYGSSKFLNVAIYCMITVGSRYHHLNNIHLVSFQTITSCNWNFLISLTVYCFKPLKIISAYKKRAHKILHLSLYQLILSYTSTNLQWPTCKQHGQKQQLHLRPRDRCITSFDWLLRILMSHGRWWPQQFLVQQHVSGINKQVKHHTKQRPQYTRLSSYKENID